MKKKVTLTLLIIIGILFSIYAYISHSNKEWKDVVLPSDEILLINRHLNFAWGYSNYGLFVDSEGGVYSFNFSKTIYNLNEMGTDADFINKLHTIRANEEPVAILNASLLKELYWYISKVNIHSTFSQSHRLVDAGTQSLMIYDTASRKLITCHQTGDYDGELQDEYAKKIYSLYIHEVQSTLNFNEKLDEFTNFFLPTKEQQ